MTDERSADAFAERLFGAALGAVDMISVHLGDRLGYYREFASGPLTAPELAERSGADLRYTREWIEQQAVTGILDVVADGDDPHERRFSLPAEHAEVLTDRDSLRYLTPLANMFAAAAAMLPELARAYQAGGGVSWDTFGDMMRGSQGDMNRPSFLSLLGAEWFPAVPELHDRLSSGPAMVADVGCGFGWSSIAMATAYPQIEVHGYDVDGPSIDQATRNAEGSGVADRVRFHAADGGDPSIAGTYDLVTAFECIHDIPTPVEVLTNMRRLRADDGSVVVMDEKVAERFAAPGDDIERLMYGFSLTVCLPDSMSTPGSAATGTVMRPDTLRGYAREAGFADIEILPVDHDMWRFYRLVG